MTPRAAMQYARNAGSRFSSFFFSFAAFRAAALYGGLRSNALLLLMSLQSEFESEATGDGGMKDTEKNDFQDSQSSHLEVVKSRNRLISQNTVVHRRHNRKQHHRTALFLQRVPQTRGVRSVVCP